MYRLSILYPKTWNPKRSKILNFFRAAIWRHLWKIPLLSVLTSLTLNNIGPYISLLQIIITARHVCITHCVFYLLSLSLSLLVYTKLGTKIRGVLSHSKQVNWLWYLLQWNKPAMLLWADWLQNQHAETKRSFVFFPSEVKSSLGACWGYRY